MNRDIDPYRTLGLPRGATLDEVKRAYRRLAKANHPDSAGEAALPRFLAIQAAYERLAGSAGGGGGASGRASGGSTSAGRGASGPGSSAGQRRPPGTHRGRDRGDATHRAYGARARRPAGDPASGGPGRDRSTGNGPGTRRGTRTGGRPGPERPPNRATPGSTSYDGAADEPFDPDWAGASWYGTSSGTYWTINPKEYADPRKHGPEYQARARRTARTDPASGVPPPSGTVEGPDPETNGPAPGRHGPEPQAAASARETVHEPHARRSWWTANTGGASAGPGERARSADPPPPRDPAAPDPVHVARSALGVLFDGAPPGRIGPLGRIVLAIAGGLPPIAGIGWLAGELTGCARFAATCEGGVEAIVVAAAALIVAVLAVLARVAAVAAAGTLVLIFAAVPATVLLSATGGSRLPDASATVLGVVLVAAWIGGAAYAIGRRRWNPPAGSGPVS